MFWPFREISFCTNKNNLDWRAWLTNDSTVFRVE